MANYRQPRRLNPVSGVMLLIVLAAAYWMFVFFPVYWDAFTVDHQLHEGAAQMYQLSLIAEPTRTTEMRRVLKKVQADCIRLANIKDPEFDVAMDIEGTNIILRGEYTVKVKHPVGNWVTVLHLKRSEKADIKRVSWD